MTTMLPTRKQIDEMSEEEKESLASVSLGPLVKPVRIGFDMSENEYEMAKRVYYMVIFDSERENNELYTFKDFAREWFVSSIRDTFYDYPDTKRKKKK